MKLSARARYAMRMMVAIARESKSGESVSLNIVADITGVSRRYLEQVAIGLKSASLIRGTMGRSGGYSLMRAPKDITLGEIIESAIGPINIVECVRAPGSCVESDVCECRWVYDTINERISTILQELSLDDLMDRPMLTGIRDGQLGNCSTTTKRVSNVSKEDQL